MSPQFNHTLVADNLSSTASRLERMATQNSGTPRARIASEKFPKIWHSYLNDPLGKHVTSAVELLRLSPSWDSFVQAYRGPSLLSSAVSDLPHPTASSPPTQHMVGGCPCHVVRRPMEHRKDSRNGPSWASQVSKGLCCFRPGRNGQL
jgi:hypothetical protein